MRRNRVQILGLIVLSLLLCVSSFAQNKVAVVDTDVFFDEKNGITELVVANNKFCSEAKPIYEQLERMLEKQNKLVDEIKKAIENCKFECSTQLVEKKIAEDGKFVDEIKLKANELINQLKKRKSELVVPVFKRIVEKVDIFKQKKGYLVIIDISKNVESSFFIYEEDSSIDVTNEFIKFCNEEFEKEKSQKQ